LATIRAAIVHVMSLAPFAAAHTRSWAANSINSRIRLPGILATTAHFVSTSNRVGLICPWLR
jgi:hypothetical protein